MKKPRAYDGEKSYKKYKTHQTENLSEYRLLACDIS